MNRHQPVFNQNKHQQRGASLIMVMMILIVVSLLGVGGAQIALMSERGARNDRDMQVAWQAAEAALIDAEFDITTGTRNLLFDGKKDSYNYTKFVESCGTSGTSLGLCAATASGKPAWLTVNFTATGSGATTTPFGSFTSRTFAAGGVGIQPAKVPRYIIELVEDSDKKSLLYRVTAMGFGPRDDIQAVLQMIYRKP